MLARITAATNAADQKFLYGHIWVAIAVILRHPLWRTIGLPLAGLLYVRA